MALNPHFYRIYARHKADPACYYCIEVTVGTNYGTQMLRIREEFGPNWEIFSERFPKQHPYAKLQARLNSYKHVSNLGRPKRNWKFDYKHARYIVPTLTPVEDLTAEPTPIFIPPPATAEQAIVGAIPDATP